MTARCPVTAPFIPATMRRRHRVGHGGFDAQGADCCGHVVAVGEGVDEARIGEREIVRALQATAPRRADDPDHYATWTFGSKVDSSVVEYGVTFADDALAVDCEWTDGELAPTR